MVLATLPHKNLLEMKWQHYQGQMEWLAGWLEILFQGRQKLLKNQ